MWLSPIKHNDIQIIQTPVIQSLSVESRNYEIKPRDLNKWQIFNTYNVPQKYS